MGNGQLFTVTGAQSGGFGANIVPSSSTPRTMKQKALSASLRAAPSYGEQLIHQRAGMPFRGNSTGWGNGLTTSLQFNKGKHRDGKKANPCSSTGQELPAWGATMQKWAWGPGGKRPISQQHTPAATKANQIQGCMNKSTASPLLNTGEAESRTPCPTSGSQSQRD